MYTSQWSAHRADVLAVAQRVKISNPEAWNELKVKGQRSRRYINIVSAECIAAGIPAGVNLKRGGPDESIDVLAFPNASGCADSTGRFAGLELIDICGGAEGGPDSTPTLGWTDVTQATIDGGSRGGWKAGSTSEVSPTPVPVPPASALKSREQFGAEFSRVNAFYSGPDGLMRVGGMVAGVDASVFNVLRGVADGSITDPFTIRNACAQLLALQCDVPSMVQWGYDLMAGATVDAVLEQIRQSDEWKRKHL